MRNGQISGTSMSATLMPVMPVTTNSSSPIGGVIMPIIRLTIGRTPKCTGSMPSAVTVGITIGHDDQQHQQRVEEAAEHQEQQR